MKRILSLILFLSALSIGAYAQSPVCPYSSIITGTSSASIISTQTKSIRICKIIFNVVQGASASNFSLISGTGSACGTGTVQVTLIFTGVASSTQVYDVGFDQTIGLQVGPNVGLCISYSGTPSSATAQVIYGLY